MPRRSTLAFLLLTGALAAQGLVRPLWVTNLPQEPGRVYAVGLAPTSAGQADALTQAGQNARAEVLTRLRANVRAETSVVSKATVTRQGGATTASSEQQVGQDTRIQAQATELPGLGVAETWLDAKGGTAYALAYLDVPLAERELRTRFTAQSNDLAQETGTPAAPRERMRLLGRLKQAQVEMAKLDDMAALVAAGGGDAQLRGRIRAARMAVDRRAEQLRGSLTLSLEGAKGAANIAALLRNAALKAGLGWAESGGEFQLALEYRSDASTARIQTTQQQQQGNGWWRGGWVSHTSSKDTGIIVARGVLAITLKDRAGTQYESMDVEAKGLGLTDFQAEQKLKEDFRAKLEQAFAQWLENLVR